MAGWRRIRTLPRKQMMKRIARFRKLKGSDGGLPDSRLPESRRKLYAVIGFQPPRKRSSRATTSPVGDDASAMPAIAIAEGFNLGYCKARPGKGPLMHNHDTNETFIPMTGRWRCEWNEGRKKQHVDLGPYDVISFPPGVARRFMNVTYDEPGQEHLLMFVIGGNQPRAEFTPAAMRRCAEGGYRPR
jgi:mannose-6-phosphate isomerase-like protein (cupin superfamily)